MVMTASTMLPLGTKAPDFSLRDAVDGKTVKLADVSGGEGLLVMFICKHCPFVVHLERAIAQFAKEYQPKGLKIVAISSNDAATHPDDKPENLAEQARRVGFAFPYLYDETQAAAKAYHAACTPDFFLFDKDLKLAYRGQFDDSRPQSGIPVTGADLRAACDAILAGKPAPATQKPSMGCNIKWKSGSEPDYFTGRPPA